MKKIVSLIFCALQSAAIVASAEPGSTSSASDGFPVHLRDTANAPIFYTIAEAYRLNAESEQHEQRRKEMQEASFNLFSHAAQAQSPQIARRAQARKLECYLNGEGVAVDYKSAKLIAGALAKQKKCPAARWLAYARAGQMFCLGQGLQYDPTIMKTGLGLLIEAANQEDNEYANLLATNYLAALPPSISTKYGIEVTNLEDLSAINVSPEIKELNRACLSFQSLKNLDTLSGFLQRYEGLNKQCESALIPEGAKVLIKTMVTGALNQIKPLFDSLRNDPARVQEIQPFINAHMIDLKKYLNELANHDIQLARCLGTGMAIGMCGHAGVSKELLDYMHTINADMYPTVRAEAQIGFLTLLLKSPFNEAGDDLRNVLEEISAGMEDAKICLSYRLIGKINLVLTFLDEDANGIYDAPIQRAIAELDSLLALSDVASYELQESDDATDNATTSKDLRSALALRAPEVADQIEATTSIVEAATVFKNHLAGRIG